MAKAVRFTIKEREWVIGWLEPALRAEKESEGRAKAVKLGESVLAKLTASAEVKPAGLSVQKALEAFRAYLGNRLVVPPSGAGPIYAMMARRLAALGLSEEDCNTIAFKASSMWQGPVKAQSLINNAEMLLQAAEGNVETKKRDSSPAEMDEL